MEESFANTTLGQNSWVDSNLGNSSHSQLIGSTTLRENSRIAKEAYKQASSLFLTRRLTEALSVIQPLIVPPLAEQIDVETQGEPEAAIISSASRNLRIKIWSLYLTLLNAIVELGPEDGKASFGSKVWRDIVNKVQDGSIWEDVVQVGYRGFEGTVDDEVVINLVTLLLSHSPSQTTNQQRLESYLSTPSVASESNEQFDANNGISSSINGHIGHPNGTTTPQGLASRTKILELYSLHVLPRNGEWAYAKEFINMSDVLDEEGRKSFVEALQSLEVEKSKDLEQLRRLEAERIKELETLQRLEAEKSSDLAALRSLEVEKAKDKTHEAPPETPSNNKSVSKPPRRTAKAAKDLHPNVLSRPIDSSNRPRKLGIYNSATSVISNLQNLLLNLAQSFSKSPMVLLRFVFFLVALVLALSRHDVRERVARILGSSWNKLRGTVGMGVKKAQRVMSRLLRRWSSKVLSKSGSLLCAGTFTWAPYTFLSSITYFEEEKFVTLTPVASEDEETTTSEEYINIFGTHHVIE